MKTSQRIDREIKSMSPDEREELRRKMEESIKEMKVSDKPKETTIRQTTSNQVYLSFWDNLLIFILSLLGLSSYEKYVRNKRLRIIKRKVSGNTPRIMNPYTKELYPQFARYLYELYETISLVKEVLDMTIFNPNVWDNSSVLEIKTCAEYLFEILTNSRPIIGISDVKSIISEYKSIKKIYDKIETEVQTSLESIDPVMVNRANRVYSRLLVFKELVEQVNFKRILKQFMDEKGRITMNATPDYVFTSELEKLSNILSETDITPMMVDVIIALKKYLEELIDKEPSYDYNNFSRISSMLSKENLDKVGEIIEKMDLVNVICILKDDPDYYPIFMIPEYSLLNIYKEVVISKNKGLATKILKEVISQKMEIFYNTIGVKYDEVKGNMLTIYTEETSKILMSHKLNYFTHTISFEIVYTFFYYFWKKGFRESVNDIIVNGIFKDRYYKNLLSSVFQSIEESEKDISNFVKQTSKGGDHYGVISKFLEDFNYIKSENSKKSLQQKVSVLNNLAGSIVLKYNDYFNQLSKNLKLILEDYNSLSPEYLLNAKTIKGIYNRTLMDNIKKGVEVMLVALDILSYYSN
ncbi:MAG: DUF5312 family protein [Spirochaetia bacterium]|nr:DUF5312 domain-containing protein [Spirochaetota bacterium]MDW8112770.1 DUF5312 family protein [Spirochaetia bacterium]